MTRRVFVSLLGTGYYRPVKYFFLQEEHSLYETRFIQVANISHQCKVWGDQDKVILFLTGKAREINWNHPAQVKDTREGPYTGLSEELASLPIRCPVENYPIPDGNNESEIWEIFKIIFDHLEVGDEIYFDVTHGFRSLPMLVLLLVNYSKFLKSCTVKSITYGNFEARNEKNEAPVVDLLPLSHLQDWTSAANMFMKAGRSEELSALLISEGVGSLDQFVSEISECRGPDLIRGGTAQKLKTELLGLNLENHSFRELIGKVYDKVSPFEDDDVLNGFRAVQFCIDHKLVQQGITLLLEFIITYVLNIVECDQPMDSDFRIAASGALNLKKIDCFLVSSSLDEDKQNAVLTIAEKIFKLPYKNKLTDIFLRLSQHSRNDLNHAGFRENPKCAGYFEERLRKYYEATKVILEI